MKAAVEGAKGERRVRGRDREWLHGAERGLQLPPSPPPRITLHLPGCQWCSWVGGNLEILFPRGDEGARGPLGKDR